jgi:hypothetical protein
VSEATDIIRKLTRREREALRTGLYFGADLRAKLVAKGLLTLKTVSMGGVKPIETPLAREICKILRERDG